MIGLHRLGNCNQIRLQVKKVPCPLCHVSWHQHCVNSQSRALMQPEEWFGAEQLLPSPKQRCWARAKPQGSRKQLQPCPGSSHTHRHRHTQVFTPRVQSSPAAPSAAKGRAACEGQHKPAHKRAHEYFPQLIQSPANPCFLRQQIHQILEGSRQLAASEFSEGKNRHWRRLVLVVFPCLTLHIREAQTLPLQHRGKAVNKSFKSVLPLHISYLSPFLSKHSSQGFQSLPIFQRQSTSATAVFHLPQEPSIGKGLHSSSNGETKKITNLSLII